MLFSKYPYHNFSDYNLDYIIYAIDKMKSELETFINFNSIKYADPILWDITRQYEQNTVVIDPYDGTAYISSKPVPTGVGISNTEYWNPIFNYGAIITELREQIAAANEEDNETASRNYTKGEFVWLANRLYKVITDIVEGTRFVEDVNVEKITIEEEIHSLEDDDNELREQIASANEEESETASKNYTAGEFVWLNKELYKVTADIVEGARFTENVNVEKITVESELDRIETNTNNHFEEIRYTVADYGIFPYPIMEDCTDALQALLDDGIDLIFPKGKYWLTKKLTINGGASIIGCGSEQTVLEWRPSSISTGIEVTLGIGHTGTPKLKNQFLVKDISLINNNELAQTAIYVDGKLTDSDRLNIAPLFRGVNITGYNAHGWNIGIDLDTCNGTVITECSISGIVAPNTTSACGVRINSDTTKIIGTEHMISNSKIAYFNHNIEADRAEGLMISNCVLLACNYGVYWVSTTGQHPHCAIENTHINAQQRNVKLDSIAQSTISNNLFYLADHGASSDGLKSVEISGSASASTAIQGNVFFVNSGTYACEAISYGGDYGAIYGNNIQIGPNSTAIHLTSSSSFVKVYGNSILTTGTLLLNEGTSNYCDLEPTVIIAATELLTENINLIGNNYISYTYDGVIAHVSFSVGNATIPVDSLIYQIPVKGDIEPLSNYVVFEAANGATAIFEFVRTGYIRAKSQLAAGSKFSFNVHLKYKK